MQPPPVLAAVGVVSAVLGLAFNGYILLVLVHNRPVRTANNLMLLHLGLADCLLCIHLLLSVSLQQWLSVSVSPAAEDLLLPHGTTASSPPSSSQLCVGLGFAWTALLPVVVWSLAGLNCDRYCAIVAPLHYSRLAGTRRALAFVLCIWLLGLALALPPLFHVNPYAYREARGGCSADFTDPASGPWYSAVYAACALLLPTAVMVFCNVRVFLIARFHRHRIVSALYEITLRAQATILHQRTANGPFYLAQFRGRCAVFTVLQLVGSVIFLYFPYFGVSLDEAIAQRPSADMLVTAATALVACSPPTHGFVYGVKSRVLRETFKNILRRQLYQSEVHSEIQRQASRRASLQQPSSSSSQQQLRRSSADAGLPRRLLQRRMSEILNVPSSGSPRPSSHRRLSDVLACSPTRMSQPPPPAALEWLARSRHPSGDNNGGPPSTEGSCSSPATTLEEESAGPSRATTPSRPLSRQSGSVRFCLEAQPALLAHHHRPPDA